MIRILHVCPLPPLRSGIVDYGIAFRKALNSSCQGLAIEALAGPERLKGEASIHDLTGLRGQKKELLKAGRECDIIHFEMGYHNAREFHLLLSLAFHRRICPVVATLHDPPLWFNYPVSCLGLENYWVPLRKVGRVLDLSLGWGMVALAKRVVAEVMVLSQTAKKAVSRRKSLKKVSYLPSTLYRNARPAANKHSGPTRILCLGFMSLGKGVDVLLAAISSMLNDGGSCCPPFEVVVAGQPAKVPGMRSPLDKWKAMAKELKLTEVVTFPGYIPDSQLLQVFDQADIFVMAHTGLRTLSASGGMIRAMEAGAVVVGTTATNLGDWIESGVSGLIYDTDDVDQLARHLSQLLRSPDLRRTMADRAQDMIWRDHNWSRVAQKTGSVYRRLLKKQNIC